MKRRILASLFVLVLLLLYACAPQTAEPPAETPSASLFVGEQIGVTAAVGDMYRTDVLTTAECAVPALRAELPYGEGKWYSADVSRNDPSSSAPRGERFMTLVLAEAADLEGVAIQWYQGGSSAVDIGDEKQRSYRFYITVSQDGREWTTVYPSDFDSAGIYARSDTGPEVQEYPCVAEDVRYVRICGAGCVDPKDASCNKYFAIRNVSVYGTGSGRAGGEVAALVRPEPLPCAPYNARLRDLLYTEKPVTVYFLRHGKSDYTSSTNATAPLNPAGVAQTALISDYFRNEAHVKLDAVYSSPYRRCVQTVELLCEQLGLELTVNEHIFEREIGGGTETIPQGFAAAQWAEYEYKLEGGESLADVESRFILGMTEVFDEIAADPECDTVLVSTHAAAMSVFLNAYMPDRGVEFYNCILSMNTPCVRCTFLEDKCIDLQLIEIGR